MRFLPNPLATRHGRLIAFFLLYITEGIPLGFTSTAMVTQLRMADVDDQAIGVFVASLYFPWAWKWAIGPVVDLFYSNRLGPRRGWILAMQTMMVLTLFACMPIEMNSANLGFLTTVVLIHNAFCATQDVAIDALACNVLKAEERGLANGLMFGGQTLGIPLGGACVLYMVDGIDSIPFLRHGIPFQWTYWFVAGCITLITLLVVLPMREKPNTTRQHGEHAGRDLKTEIVQYLKTAFRSFFGSRPAFFALIFALMPAGAVALNLALQKTLAVELGMTMTEIADLEVVSSVVWALMCVTGGLIADRVGHLKSLAVFLALISIPTFWLGYQMQLHNYIMPVKQNVVDSAEAVSDATNASGTTELAVADPSDTQDQANPASSPDATTSTMNENQPPEPASDDVPTAPRDGDEKAGGHRKNPAGVPLIPIFWTAVMVYMACQGLMYGTRTAVFMRIANPDVAATQFTAYMAMMNLVTSYSAIWQGWSITNWGYPTTLYLDGAAGLACLAILPLLYSRATAELEVPHEHDLTMKLD